MAGPHLVLDAGVAVHVLDEVAIDAVHALLQVDVHQVDRDARFVLAPRWAAASGSAWPPAAPRCRRAGSRCRRGRRMAVAVLLEDGPEDPAVAVEVGELGVLGLRVQVGQVRPGTPGRTRLLRADDSFGVGRSCAWTTSSAVGCLLLRRVHQFAVGLLVPPHEADVAVHDVGAGMDVADDALAGRDALPVANWCSIGWPGSFLGMVGSVEKLRPWWPYFGIGAGIDRRAVVGIDDVAGGAAAGAVVAGVVVGAQEVERRVEQAGLLQAEQTGSVRFWVPRPRTLRRVRRPARIFQRVRGCRSRGRTRRRARRCGGCCPAARSRSAAADRGRARRPCLRISSSVGGGTVCSRCGAPFML